MENSFVLIVLLLAALATGGLVVNWVGLGRAMSRLSVSQPCSQAIGPRTSGDRRS
jgi:hypothetical protein